MMSTSTTHNDFTVQRDKNGSDFATHMLVSFPVVSLTGCVVVDGTLTVAAFQKFLVALRGLSARVADHCVVVAVKRLMILRVDGCCPTLYCQRDTVTNIASSWDSSKMYGISNLITASTINHRRSTRKQ